MRKTEASQKWASLVTLPPAWKFTASPAPQIQVDPPSETVHPLPLYTQSGNLQKNKCKCEGTFSVLHLTCSSYYYTRYILWNLDILDFPTVNYEPFWSQREFSPKTVSSWPGGEMAIKFLYNSINLTMLLTFFE